MRALVISDIHANLQALEAVLRSAPPYDEVWNLGDVVGYGANPNEVAEVAQSLGGPVIRGNHDRACSGMSDLEDFSETAAEAARWTRLTLEPSHRSWLAALPRGPLRTPGLPVQLVHGSPRDEDEYLVSREQAHALLSARANDLAPQITFFGHTHMQGGFAYNGEDDFSLVPQYSSTAEAESFELPLRRGARYLLNPGSVGQPRDGDWRAAFAIFDEASELFTWFRVPYNVSEAQNRIRHAGVPDFLARRLAAGR